MSLDPKDAIAELGPTLREHTLVPFCGAGISLASTPRLPTALAFVRQAGLDQLSWAQATTVLSKSPGFKVRFKETFADPPNAARAPSRQHRLLASLDAKYYVTTNYDELLERALAAARREGVGVLNRLQDTPRAESYRNLVIKLHGDVRSDELLVFSAADYMKRWQAPTLVDAFVSLLFSTHTILFVGYSLNDEHIVSILERESLVAPPERRRKYMLVYELHEQHRKYFEAVNVIPIDVASLGRSHEDAVCEFLYRLWEQHDYFKMRTQVIEDRPKTQTERLYRAMIHHQDGQSERAKQYLDEMYGLGIDSLQYMESLPGFLWLNVSTHDKLDDWGGLVATERGIRSLFQNLEQSAPAEVVQMLRMSYFATLALAYVRHGDIAGARQRIAVATASGCTDTAHTSLQITNANALTTKALVDLVYWAETPEAIGVLADADTALNDALGRFVAHGGLGMSDESHHLGRYFGTRVFVDAALLETRQRDIPLETILANACRAHTPPDRRPSFGQIAGKYCEAYAHWLAALHSTDGTSAAVAQRSVELARDVRSAPGAGAAVLTKASLLIEHAQALVAGASTPSQSALDPVIAAAPAVIREQILRMGARRWIGLPLN